YGGGGILPDVFVPKDISDENEVIDFVTQSGFINYFVFEHLDKNRQDFENLVAENFFENYVVSNQLLKEFIIYSRLDESKLNFEAYEKLIKLHLKANIASQLFGADYYEKIITQSDPMIDKVIELEFRN